jgi:hypothetical protein
MAAAPLSVRPVRARVPQSLLLNATAFVYAVFCDFGVPPEAHIVAVARELAQAYEAHASGGAGDAARATLLEAKFDRAACRDIARDVAELRKQHPFRQELPRWCASSYVAEDVYEALRDDAVAIFDGLPEEEGEEEEEEEEKEKDKAVGGGGGGGGHAAKVSKAAAKVERNLDLMRRSLAEHFLLPDGFDEHAAAAWVLDCFRQQSADAPVNTWAREGNYAEGRSYEDLVLPDVRARNRFLGTLGFLKEGGSAFEVDPWGEWAYSTICDQQTYLTAEMESYVTSNVADFTPRGHNIGGLLHGVVQKYVLRARAPWLKFIATPPVSAAPGEALDRTLRDLLDYFWGRMKLTAARAVQATLAAAAPSVLVVAPLPALPGAEAAAVEPPPETKNEVARRIAGALARYVENVSRRGEWEE